MPLTLAAGVRIRPIEGGAYEVGVDGVYFKLDEPAALILTLFDGQRDPEAVRAEAARRGMPVSVRSIQALVEGLGREGLLTDAGSLPLAPLPDAPVVCSQCGYCCHLTIGPLDDAEVDRLGGLDWAGQGFAAPAQWLRTDGSGGDAYLAQGPDDACVFLDPDGLCRIHKVFGEEAKPDPCRLFPLTPVLRAGEVRVGLTQECRGLARAAEHGVPVAEEAARLDAVIRRSLQGYPVLPDVDPGGVLWAAVAEAPDADAALRALAVAVTDRCEPGDLGADGLLDDLIGLAGESRDQAPSEFLRSEEETVRAALAQLRDRGPATHGQGTPPELLLGHLRSQIFIGEPTGRLGTPAGVAILALTIALARRLSTGLAGAVGGLRCVDRVDTIPNAGARVVREAVELAVLS